MRRIKECMVAAILAISLLEADCLVVAHVEGSARSTGSTVEELQEAEQDEHKCEGIWTETVAPSCTAEGEEQKICSLCRKVMETRVIREYGHDYQDCICSRCGLTKEVDDQSGTLILTRDIYTQLGLETCGEVQIPGSAIYMGKQYRVVGIGEGLFASNEDLTSINMPDSVKYIEAYAFDGCKNLTFCNLPKGLLRIGKAAFQCCYSLKELTLPSSLAHIGNFAYNHCSGIENKTIRIPSKVTSLGNECLYPAHMFYDCGKDDVFTEFVVDPANGSYKTVNGILYSKDGATLVAIPRGMKFKNDTYVMPNTVRNLGELSFSRNPNIKRVIISDELKVDGEMSAKERLYYNNHGNDLSIACYAYTCVERYEVKESNENFTSYEGVLFSKNMSRMVAVPNHYKGTLQIPEGVVRWEHEAIWTEIEYFNGQAMNQITEIVVPSSMAYIDTEQLQAVNLLVDLYGTTISVSQDNKDFWVDQSGHICQI